jgi:hypothetical protein
MDVKHDQYKFSMSIELTKEQAQKLGFKSSIQIGEDLSYVDFNKSSVYALKNTFLDLENLGKLKEENPRIVTRKPLQNTQTLNSEINVWKTWRQVIENEHYYVRYQIKTPLIGQLAEIHFSRDFYSYKDNNFFKPFRGTKTTDRIKPYNNFTYGRFRFPKYVSNTIEINTRTSNGAYTLRPKYPGIISKEEQRKAYYRWYPSHTKFASGVQQSPYDNLNLSGFHIPYPNTISVYNGPQFNVPTKIAPKFNENNSQALNGLIVISTGDAEEKTICYVSPHTIQTGFLNTIEDIYTETQGYSNSLSAGSNSLATISNSSWYGTGYAGAFGYLGCGQSGYLDNLNGTYRRASIPSANKTHQRYYKVGDSAKQIYFDHTLPTPYGPGRWCISVQSSANIGTNRNHSGVVYIHSPNSKQDWRKKDPRKLSGPWVVASGHPLAANATYLDRAAAKKPNISRWKACRKTRRMQTVNLQIPSVMADSEYLNSGFVLPEGAKKETYPFVDSIYPTWVTKSIVTGTLPNTGLLINPTGNQYSGYIISGQAISHQQILDSGISIPQMVYSGSKYTISNSGHFQQSTPLKDTYFYKFYNQLYQNNNKTIATGTWDGIIPSGVRFSVELISVNLNKLIGTSNDQNISVFYSGYGNQDPIDIALQTGISRVGAHELFPNPSAQYEVSGQVPWHQKRYPYRHAFNNQNYFVYTAFKSGPTPSDAKSIARAKAIKTVNSKILQLVNKIFPNLTYKNKKWKRLQIFKSKLADLKNSTFSRIIITSTAEPGSETKLRFRPYSQNMNNGIPLDGSQDGSNFGG